MKTGELGETSLTVGGEGRKQQGAGGNRLSKTSCGCKQEQDQLREVRSPRENHTADSRPKREKNPGAVVCTCNPTPRILRLPGQPGLHSKTVLGRKKKEKKI